MRFDSQLSCMRWRMFSTGLSAAHFAGNGRRVAGGDDQSSRERPACLIEYQDGVGTRRHGSRYPGKVEHHAFGVAAGQDARFAFALGRADGALDIGRGGALIPGCRQLCAALGPAPGGAILLANPRLVLPPQSYGCAARIAVTWAGKFFKSRDGTGVLGMMTQARRQLAIAYGAQVLAQCLGADRHRELVPAPLPRIGQAPTQEAVCRRDGASLDSRRQRRLLEPRLTIFGMTEWKLLRIALITNKKTGRVRPVFLCPERAAGEGWNPEAGGAGWG
jgi:hypothetical protein